MERTEKVVIDASVAAKWFLDEEHRDKAIDLRTDYLDGTIDVLSPDLLPYEVLNALKYSGDLGKLELEKVAEIIENYQFALYPILGKEAVEASYEYGITIYDSAYVALAQSEEATFYTADKRLLEKIENFHWAKHLSKYRKKNQNPSDG